MNIFILDESPVLCAQYHVDRHVFKMILEAAQMMSAALRYLDGTHVTLLHPGGRHKTFWTLPGEIYTPTEDGWEIENRVAYAMSHLNHPCTIWMRQSRSNWLWCKELARQLNLEAKWRSERDEDYSSWTLIEQMPIPSNLPDIGLTKFALAMPDYCKIFDDPVMCYRMYYRSCKTHLLKYKGRDVPQWWHDMANPQFLRKLELESRSDPDRHFEVCMLLLKMAVHKLYPNAQLDDHWDVQEYVIKFIEGDNFYATYDMQVPGIVRYVNLDVSTDTLEVNVFEEIIPVE